MDLNVQIDEKYLAFIKDSDWQRQNKSNQDSRYANRQTCMFLDDRK